MYIVLETKLDIHSLSPIQPNPNLLRSNYVIFHCQLVDCCHLHVARPSLPPRPGLTHPECENSNLNYGM